MQIKSYNKKTGHLFQAVTQTGKITNVSAPDLLAVAVSFDNALDPLVQVTRTTADVISLEEAPDITFTTEIEPPDSGKVYPETFSVTPETPVIFTAVPAAAHHFLRWERNGEQISEKATDVFTVTAPDTEKGEQSVVYKAIFEADGGD